MESDPLRSREFHPFVALTWNYNIHARRYIYTEKRWTQYQTFTFQFLPPFSVSTLNFWRLILKWRHIRIRFPWIIPNAMAKGEYYCQDAKLWSWRTGHVKVDSYSWSTHWVAGPGGRTIKGPLVTGFTMISNIFEYSECIPISSLKNNSKSTRGLIE